MNNNDGKEVRNIRTNVNESHSYDSGRMSLTWEPSDELSVRFKYQNMEVNSIYPQPVAGSNGTFPFDAFAFVAGASNPFFPPVNVNYAGAANAWVSTIGTLAGAAAAGQLAFLHRPSYSDIPADGLKPEDGVALHYQNPRQNTSAEVHNLMVDYDMGSHALALRWSDSQSDSMGLIDRDYAGAYTYGITLRI
jgi:hypothetical protein